ncbi:DUF294 nucleotidyltransferase-like domain-containing protein [Vibrio hippocampi]|uniref:CBS domain-containing protein n=1 Tax=Vibrio hippocampi TaxID=654686 RepID=A0ABN8DL04_9VIBR|nr:DUF294 nucleotidyltransferase-like domain-containing protein [Vibrio hippocampi]CAH0528817.1 hypothetical protein VHP8226_02844 [Vibrio hippocampi]
MSTSASNNVYDFLVHLDPFDLLPNQVVEVLASAVTVKYLAKGECIEFQAMCEKRFLYVVRKGAIEQRTQLNKLRARLGEEDQFGFTFLEPLKDAEDGYRAEAIEDSLLYLIPHAIIQETCEQHPEFKDYFAATAKTRLHSAIRSIVNKEDKGLFFRNVGEVASESITVVSIEDSIMSVAQAMCGKKRSSCAVVLKGDEIVGLVTDRDMTQHVVANGIDTTDPIHHVMTPNPILINSEDKVIQAISLMLQYNIRCLPVITNQQVKGLLTTTHLVHNHKTQSLFLIEKIKYANSITALANLRDEKETIFQALVESGVSAEIHGQVMSMIMDAFNRRIIQLTEEVLGKPPCDYAWMVAGSHARNEVHMLSDQDNALVLAESATENDRLYFNYFAMRVCNGLAAVGYPLCSGKYMAATAKWNQNVGRWKDYYTKWVASPEYNKLLSISVFMEIRCVYGNAELVDQLQNHLHRTIHANPRFIPALTRDAIETSPPLGIFNSLVLEKSGDNTKSLNIKKFALNLIIDLARIYSLSAGGSLTGTEERFHYAVEKGTLSQESCDNIIGAYRFLTQVRFKHQLNALLRHATPDNHIRPDEFSSFERKHLKEAFKIISELQDVAKLKFVNGF